MSLQGIISYKSIYYSPKPCNHVYKRKVCIKAKLSPTSLPCNNQLTVYTTVKWSINCFVLYGLSVAKPRYCGKYTVRNFLLSRHRQLLKIKFASMERLSRAFMANSRQLCVTKACIFTLFNLSQSMYLVNSQERSYLSLLLYCSFFLSSQLPLTDSKE